MGNSNGKPVVLTDEVNLNHFRLLRVVGKGAFGKVRIVERKDTGLTFALKYIRKDEVVRSESVRNIIRERRMLEHLNHPFVCNLRYSFQDVEYLYIVVDLMTGGDLRFHITRKTFTEEAVRFWMAEIGCALRYIHQQKIVHRDVKPDNILLDFEGHAHLADFNVASELIPGKQLTSKSGTLAYLAPEVYTGRGYSSGVDWWGLGVTFYECIYNKRPFEASHSEQLAQTIVKGVPPFPVTNPPVSGPCLHAISSLLEKDKAQRIGAAGFETFTDNPFFREIDFEALERKEIVPIFCPASDKTNFDATYDLEELLLEEAPLEARARKQKPRAELREDATQAEIRTEELHKMIETMFEPFNYTLLPPDRAPAAPATSSSTSSSKKPFPTSSPTSPSEPGLPIDLAHRPKDRTQQSRSVLTTHSQTPRSRSRTRSSTHSPDGSPPLYPSALGVGGEYFPPPPTITRISAGTGPSAGPTSDPSSHPTASASTVPAIPPVPATASSSRALIATNPRTRTIRYEDGLSSPVSPSSPSPSSPATNASPKSPRVSRGGGMHRSTSFGSSGGSGNRAAMAIPHIDPALGADGPATTAPVGAGGDLKPTGMLGFLSRKKGRDRSPKAGKEKERGVIGKEGARVPV